MLMDEFRGKTGGDEYGGDINSSLQSLDTDFIFEVLRDHEVLRE